MQIFKELFRCKTLNIRALYQHLFLGTSNWTPYKIAQILQPIRE